MRCMYIILMFFVTLNIFGGTFYVSKTNGKNSNSGTIENPVQEIDKAVQLAKNGDEIKISQGTYSGTFGIGYIESDKGKFALIKSDGNTMVLKESSRVYLNNFSYFVREISSNAVVMEDGLRQMKTIYFSGETENKK